MSTLRLPGLKARACYRPDPFDWTQGAQPACAKPRLAGRRQGLTLSGAVRQAHGPEFIERASFPRLKRWGLAPPNGPTRIWGFESKKFQTLYKEGAMNLK